MSRPPSGNVFELFSITPPERPKAKGRDKADPELADRMRRIERVQEDKVEAEQCKEVWD